jgi:tetratricopeptide (TPR) repeat protein
MAERLMDALDAGRRRRRHPACSRRPFSSCAIPPGSNSTVERTVDIRVDDAVDPFKELRRLLNITLGVPRTLTDRAAELAKAGKFDAAIAEQKKALEIQPNSDTLHYALAQRYAQAGQPLMALVPLREAIRLHPNLAREAARDPLFAGLRDLGEFKRLVQVGGGGRKRNRFRGR